MILKPERTRANAGGTNEAYSDIYAPTATSVVQTGHVRFVPREFGLGVGGFVPRERRRFARARHLLRHPLLAVRARSAGPLAEILWAERWPARRTAVGSVAEARTPAPGARRAHYLTAIYFLRLLRHSGGLSYCSGCLPRARFHPGIKNRSSFATHFSSSLPRLHLLPAKQRIPPRRWRTDCRAAPGR